MEVVINDNNLQLDEVQEFNSKVRTILDNYKKVVLKIIE